MAKKSNPAVELFAAKGAEKVYAAVVSRLQVRIGRRAVVEEPKQTCVHVVAGEGGTAYAGLHPRKGGVLLNIRLQTPLKAARVRKVEQVSANRCHCEMVLSSESDVDDEVIGWLEEAWRLASQGGQRRGAK